MVGNGAYRDPFDAIYTMRNGAEVRTPSSESRPGLPRAVVGGGAVLCT